MLKIKPQSSFLKKKNRFFNFFHFNTYLNLFLKCGNSKLFKKLFLRFFYFYKYKYFFCNNFLATCCDFETLIENFIFKKSYNMFFSTSSSLIYENHRKKYISRLNFSLTKTKKRKYFFLKFCKYFFFKKK